jgi:hypothetical protein
METLGMCIQIKALEYYFKALKINEEIGDKQGQAINLGNIGIVYHTKVTMPRPWSIISRY